MNKNHLLLTLTLVLTLFISGCDVEAKSIFSSADSSRDELIKVEITFTDDERLTAYVKNLGIDKDAVVYVGGSSMNYLYDSNGNIVGSFNYQRVLYMKIITEAKTD